MPPLVDGLPTVVGGARARRAVPWSRTRVVHTSEPTERSDHELQRPARRPQEEEGALAGAAGIRARRLEADGAEVGARTFGDESDIDLRLELEEKVRFNLRDLEHFSKRIEQATGRSVDVITARTIKSRELRDAFERDKELVYDREGK